MNILCNVLNRRANAVAYISGGEKYPDIKGTVMFYTTCNAVLVRAEISDLPTANTACKSPVFGFHIHSGSDCGGTAIEPFADTGTHFNPENCKHPYHAGDMPPLFGADGKAFLMFLTDRFSVNDVIGRTVVIHAMPDDFMTQPSGNSGEKIACGVIKRI